MKKIPPSVLSWLKEFFSLIGQLISSLFLIVLAISLFIPLFFGAMIWKIVVSVKHDNRKAREIISGTSKFFTALAIAIDQLGNVAFGGFFNWLFIIDSEDFPFGNTHETVSEVLGWNQNLENLTRHGKLLVAILEVIEEDHCLKAMTSGLFDAKYKIEYFRKVQAKIRSIEETKEFMAKYN